MPEIYIYNGTSKMIDVEFGAQTLPMRDGQIVFDTGRNNNEQNILVTYADGVRYQWAHPDNGMFNPQLTRDTKNGFHGGYIVHISHANKVIYGSVNDHPASGGSIYTMRKGAQLRNGAGANVGTLYAGDALIIGGSYPHGSTDSGNFVRMWGYRRGGKTGVETETSGLYCDTDFEATAPTGYTINTQ